MPRRRPDGSIPNWSRLCRLAGPQGGYFSALQAQGVGFSLQLLQYYIQKSLIQRTQRGIFHLSQYPRGDNEELISLWLWSRCEGIASHETALWFHGLLPGTSLSRLCFILPTAWRKRRVRLPAEVLIYYADVPIEDIVSRGPVPMTNPVRSLVDVVQGQTDAGVIDKAIRTAVKNKLITRAQLQRAVRNSPPALLAKTFG